MSTFARYITGSAFLFYSMFNSQLVYDAEMFRTQPEKVEIRVTDMHTITDRTTGQSRFFKPAFDANMDILGRFYGQIVR